MAKTYGQTCPVARTLEIIGERWTLLIIRELFRHGSQRFQDLQDTLTGVAPNVLSDRLKTLEEHGLIRREFYSQHPPRAAYVLTPVGRELHPTMRALAAWGAKHLGGETRVLHEACGHDIEMRPYCPHCETELANHQVKVTWPDDLRGSNRQRRAR
ncbi:MAG: winged helix-turn-helix transcriptional regulator [Alphaproteobacteria bacterium]|nr:winged helix-turn-helix transcriptional regulator [Alphaproteobacteria bacterium]